MIAVKFDDRTWARLVVMAERQGVTIAQLLEAAAQRLATGTSTVPGMEGRSGLAHNRAKHRDALVAEIVALRKKGQTIAGIAQITGYSKSYVSKLLCDNGGRTWERNERKAS